MKNVAVVFLGLMIAVVVESSCGNKPSVQEKNTGTGKSEQASAVAPKPTLDIIIGGPFVFVQGASCSSQASPCIGVWAPKVRGHVGMVGFASQIQFKKFDSGDYDFTSGIHGSNTTTLVTPVQNASIYSTSSKARNLTSTPKKKPFATVLLPKPREIVSWNADPMTISSNGSPVANAPTDNLATLTILRYDYQQGDNLEVTSGGDIFWAPQPITIGNERIVVIGFIPENANPNEDEHAHAYRAFQAATDMLGLKWKITFQPLPGNFERNRPFDANWPLPQDLLNFIDKAASKSMRADSRTLAKEELEILGKINDCKAPAILVSP